MSRCVLPGGRHHLRPASLVALLTAATAAAGALLSAGAPPLMPQFLAMVVCGIRSARRSFACRALLRSEGAVGGPRRPHRPTRTWPRMAAPVPVERCNGGSAARSTRRTGDRHRKRAYSVARTFEGHLPGTTICLPSSLRLVALGELEAGSRQHPVAYACSVAADEATVPLLCPGLEGRGHARCAVHDAAHTAVPRSGGGCAHTRAALSMRTCIQHACTQYAHTVTRTLAGAAAPEAHRAAQATRP